MGLCRTRGRSKSRTHHEKSKALPYTISQIAQKRSVPIENMLAYPTETNGLIIFIAFAHAG